MHNWQKLLWVFSSILFCNGLMYGQWTENKDTMVYTVILAACPDTLRSATEKNVFYVFENDCSELVGYKGGRQLWKADLKLLFNNPDARATELTQDANSVLSVSNNHQCISVRLNARTGRKVED